MKWSTVLQSREQAPKSPVPFPLPPLTARPNLHFQPRVLPPCQPGHKRHRRPRWKASSIGSTSGRPTIRKPRAGKGSTVESGKGVTPAEVAQGRAGVRLHKCQSSALPWLLAGERRRSCGVWAGIAGVQPVALPEVKGSCGV